jgi:tRNA (guanine37-N1)-methyltransferase
MFDDFPEWGVTGRAVECDQVQLNTWNPRDFSADRFGRVDDRPYGGGPGMVMRYQPLADAIDAVKAESSKTAKVIYFSPQGRCLNQLMIEQLAQEDQLILLAGRYEGVDERLIEDYVDEEVSIGDYVLSGGEFAAFVMIDAVIRLLPGVLGNEESAQQDSFSDGLLDCPHYTRPEHINQKAVPEVLLSGHHDNIKRWRFQQMKSRTKARRPELFEQYLLSQAEINN